MKTKKNLKEGKWNHDAVGRSGPISVYRDGTESVKFYMENDKWMYSVTKPNGDQAPGFSFGKSAGTVDAQYSKYFDNGNIRGMTVAAKKILKEDHTNRPGKHFKNIRNVDYDVNTADGDKIAKFIDKGKQYHFNVDKITSIRRLKPNTISIGGEYVDNRKFYKEFTIQELEKILDKKLKFVNSDREIKESMKPKKQIKESTMSLNDLEDYFYENESNIRDNMETYGFKLKDISKIRNYMDFASVLGTDSRDVKDVDLQQYTSTLAGLLMQEQVESKQFKLANIAKKNLKEAKTITSAERTKIVNKFSHKCQPNVINAIIDEYLDGKSQALIAKITGADFDKYVVPITNMLPHITVGANKDPDDRKGDDPSSKQYYDRTIKRESKQFKFADIAKKILKEDNTNQYKTDLNSILEDDANNELMSKINAKDYNNFFTCLQKLDKKASEKAMELDDQFPLDELDQAVQYLEDYLGYFGNSQCKTFMLAIIDKIKK